MQENSKFFFSYAKKVSGYKSPVGPFVDEKGNVIKEPACITLNKQYASVFTKPDPNSKLPKDYPNSEEDSPSEDKIIEYIKFY